MAILLGAVALTGSFVALKWRDSKSFFEPRLLLARFPVREATVLSIDFAPLRYMGAVGSPIAMEPEYRAFVEATGFNFRTDLDSVVATISPKGNYFIARGRFHWDRLQAYALKQGGSCYERLCRMQGSTPERHISFVPLRDDAIAIGVSTDDLAATRLTKPGKAVETAIPEGPAWMIIPGSALRSADSLPGGMRYLLSALSSADHVVVRLTVSPAGIEARLEAPCKTAVDAGILVSQLKTATALLKNAVLADKQAAKDELALTLTAGAFEQNDKVALGRWPIKQGLLLSLLTGL